MTTLEFIAAETGAASASPVELYEFAHGAAVYRYTSGDAAVHTGAGTFALEAISRTEVELSEEDLSGTITITVPADNAVAKLFAAANPSNQVFITVSRQHRTVPGEIEFVFQGVVASASFDGVACSLTCQPVGSVLSKQIPTRLYQPQCGHVLFSQTEYYGTGGAVGGSAQSVGCNVNRENFKTTAVVGSALASTITAPAFASKPDGYFTAGKVETLDGETRYITSHIGNTITVAYPVAISVGDTVSVYPGCDGLAATCRSKFNNIINFYGFNKLPRRNPFNSALV